MILVIDKMDGNGLSNTVCYDCLPRRLKINNIVLATEGAPDLLQDSTSVIKVSGQMCSDAFKRRLAFSFTLIILA